MHRHKPTTQPFTISAADASFRLLCPSSKIGAIIGKSGSIVRLIRHSTGAKIHVEAPPSPSDECSVLVAAPSSPSCALSLDGLQDLSASPAQDALLRVYDRLLAVNASSDADAPVSCRVLATSGHVGCVMGKGGKVIKRIRDDTGAKIRVLAADHQLPPCASPSDEIIQITGDALAVKRALIHVSKCLQENPQSDKQVFANRQTGLSDPFSDSHGSIPNPYFDNFLHGSTFPPPAPGSSADQALRESSLLAPFDKTSRQVVTFRLLCSNDRVGGIIGKAGSIIKALESETGASLNVGPTIAESEYRVITISGVENPDSKYFPAEDAVARAFARSIEVGIEKGLESGLGKGAVSARLLVPSDQIGCLIGKGSTRIAEITRSTGAMIRIFGGDQVPKCASDDDEVVQIIGDALTVNGALISVMRCLKNPPLDREQAILNGSSGLCECSVDLHGSALDSHLDHTNSFQSSSHGSSHDLASSGHVLPTYVETISVPDQKKSKQEVAFRLLCSNDRVGGVIGKGGKIVKVLENETGASINVGPCVPETWDRVITISGMEIPETQHSVAQNAVARVFARSVEAGIERGPGSRLGNGVPVSVRLLVSSEQIGCLVGKGGAVIAEISKATGAGIRVFGGNKVPKCALVNDEVVQITGKFGSVQDALFHVTRRLRDYILATKNISVRGFGGYPSSISEYASYGKTEEPKYSSFGLSHNLERLTIRDDSKDNLGLSDNLDLPSSPTSWLAQEGGGVNAWDALEIGRGLPPYRGFKELGSGNEAAVVTNTSMDIMIPEHIMEVIYGENGSNLSRIRQISGAKVAVNDPQLGVRERMVVISGTPDQTQVAQSLLQAFILTVRSGAGLAS